MPSSDRVVCIMKAIDRRRLSAFARGMLNWNHAGHRLTFDLFAPRVRGAGPRQCGRRARTGAECRRMKRA